MVYAAGGVTDTSERFVLASFLGIALYNVIELNVIMYSTFKRRDTLYFWSFFFATWGVAFHTIGFLLQIFDIVANGYVYITIATVGWIPMVTGQSLLLYSRLHLILHDQRVLRMVLAMIITNVFIAHIPTSILTYRSVAVTHSDGPFAAVYAIYEKIELTLFFLQEVIISTIYIWCCQKHFRILRGPQARQMVKHLCIINVVIIVLDITILTLEFSGLHYVQIAYKSMVYSVKLKLEFATLNSLVKLAKAKPVTDIDHRSVTGNHTQPYRKDGAGSGHYKEGFEMRVINEGEDIREGETASPSKDRSARAYNAFVEVGGSFHKPGDGILVVTSVEVAQKKLPEKDPEDALENKWPTARQEDLAEVCTLKSSSSSQERLARV